VRFLVDAMNVIGSRPDGWWRDRNAAMARLVEDLELLAAKGDHEIAVVFERAPEPALTARTVGIRHARRGGRDAADDEIVRLLASDPDPGATTVVTSDRALVERVRSLGAAVEPASSFRGRLDALGDD
jgi:predicted RNA-binding protein with PIN domain